MNTPKALSASSIVTWEQCQLKYQVIYERRIQDVSSYSALFGQATHKILELLTRNKKLPDIESICKEFNVSHKSADIRKILVSTLKNHYLDNIANCVECELRFNIELKEKNVHMNGTIDRLDIDNGNAMIIDIKTGNKPYTKKELSSNWQAKIYSLAVRKLFPEIKNIKTLFWFVKSQTRQIVEQDEDSMSKIEDNIINIYNDIIKTEKPSATINKYCKWCIWNENCETYKASI